MYPSYGPAAYTKGALVDGATITWDLNDIQAASLTLGGNHEIIVENPAPNGQYVLALKQDGTGTRIPTWSSNVKWASGTPPVLSTAANAVDVLEFISDGTYVYGAMFAKAAA
jgi:hypothetical protein